MNYKDDPRKQEPLDLTKSISISFRLKPLALAQIYDCIARTQNHRPIGYSDLIKSALNQFCQMIDYNAFSNPPSPEAVNTLASWTIQNKAKYNTSVNQWTPNNPTPHTNTAPTPHTPNTTMSPAQYTTLSTYIMEPTIRTFPKELQQQARIVWKFMQSGQLTLEGLLEDPPPQKNPEDTKELLFDQYLTALLIAESTLWTMPEFKPYYDQCLDIIDAYSKRNEHKCSEQETTNE